MKFTNPLNALRKEPAQARSQATVDTILEATAQVLHDEGERAANTNRIAERAGFSIGTLYQYFPNRGAIMAALAMREYERVLARINGALATLDPDDPEPAIRAALRGFLGAFRGRFGVRRAILIGVMRHAPDDPRLSASAIEPMLATLEERLGGRFEPLGPVGRAVLAQALLGAVRGAVLDRSPFLGTPAHEEALMRIILGVMRPSQAGAQ